MPCRRPGSQRKRSPVSTPRENVLFVPNRNVLLTRSRWGGERTRSFDHDPAGQRSAGGAEESAEEADQTVTGLQRAELVGAAGTSTAAWPGRGRGQGRGPRITRAGIESEDQRGTAREEQPDSATGDLSGSR